MRLSLGGVPPARATYVEELRGPGGAVTTLRRLHPPSWPAGPGAPPPAGRDAVLGRQALAGGDGFAASVVRPAEVQTAFHRDDAADLLVHVRQGAGKLRTMLGPVLFDEDDLLLVPRATVHRFEPDPSLDQEWVCFRAASGIAPPQDGCRGPLQLETHDAAGAFALTVHGAGGLRLHTLEHHPFDVVAWEGEVFPCGVAADDLGPRAHEAFGIPSSLWRDAGRRMAR